ncbi:hypothetical protein ACFFX0_27620 [Citricoccus parietis]|uniref:Uncharacterized protein n=1 Tax=Citricoccus parietis TaxID=592307 RepID=A0ABV5G779_9MICC
MPGTVPPPAGPAIRSRAGPRPAAGDTRIVVISLGSGVSAEWMAGGRPSDPLRPASSWQ